MKSFSGGPPHKSARVFNNIFFARHHPPMGSGVANDSHIAVSENGSIFVFNNTVIAKEGVAIDGFRDARVFNNVFVNTTNALRRNDIPVIGGNASYTFADRNLVATPRFQMGATSINSLSGWQADNSGNCGLSGGFCGTNDLEFDPNAEQLFASTPVDGQLFTLIAGSSASGKGLADIGNGLPEGAGVDLGAYPNGPFSVGNPTGDIIGPRSRPAEVFNLQGVAN